MRVRDAPAKGKPRAGEEVLEVLGAVHRRRARARVGEAEQGACAVSAGGVIKVRAVLPVPRQQLLSTSQPKRTSEAARGAGIGPSHEHVAQASMARANLHQRSRGAIADVEEVALIIEHREHSRRRRVGGQAGRADERPAG